MCTLQPLNAAHEFSGPQDSPRFRRFFGRFGQQSCFPAIVFACALGKSCRKFCRTIYCHGTIPGFPKFLGRKMRACALDSAIRFFSFHANCQNVFRPPFFHRFFRKTNCTWKFSGEEGLSLLNFLRLAARWSSTWPCATGLASLFRAWLRRATGDIEKKCAPKYSKNAISAVSRILGGKMCAYAIDLAFPFCVEPNSFEMAPDGHFFTDSPPPARRNPRRSEPSPSQSDAKREDAAPKNRRGTNSKI